jgi:phage repressor protein C with HTH and peptisase S24 domain
MYTIMAKNVSWLGRFMNWEKHKKDLASGKVVSFRPKGNSMSPKIESGQLVTVEPIQDYSKLKKGDIVFCKVKGNHYVHLVQAVDEKRFLIGNNKKGINGTVGEGQIFGKVISVED